jgi:hypothetical protein
MVHLKLYPSEYVHLLIPTLPAALGTQVRGLFLNNRHVGCIYQALQHLTMVRLNYNRTSDDVTWMWYSCGTH